MATQAETQDATAARWQEHGRTANRTAVQSSRGNINLGNINEERLAKALGWFSVGLGLAELASPRGVARLAGTHDHSPLVRFYGLRELACGIGILTRPRPAEWLWARVAGDVLDLSSLGSALSSPKNDRGRTVASLAAVAGVTVLDVICAQRLSDGQTQAGRPMRAEANMIIARSPEECYRFWRNFENLPRAMSYLQSVRLTGDRQSHWIAKGPGGVRVEWDAEIVDDIPNQRISWRSLPGSQVTHSGTVEFEAAPGNRGTIVRVQFDYEMAGSSAASTLATLFGKNPEQLANKDLRRFKQLLETGDIITTEGQPAGRTSGATWLDQIAR
jgi:uncharacterized membrane protein